MQMMTICYNIYIHYLISGVPVPSILVAPPTPIASAPAAAAAAEPSSPPPVQEELLGRVESLRRELEEKDKRLEEKEKSISKAKSKKEDIKKERDEMKVKLMFNEEKSSKLQQEKESLEQKLKSHSEKLQLLESSHDVNLQEIIREKKEKIEKLEKKLAKVKQDLKLEKTVNQDLRSRVSQLESELRQKMGELHSHEIDAIKTKHELEEQRRKLDQLNQLQAANSSQKSLLQEIQVSY